MTKHLVIFQPSGKRGYIEDGKTLIEAAQELGADIESVCGGKLICGKCAVEVDEKLSIKYGVESKGQPLSPLVEKEIECLSRCGLGGKYRLACSARIYGDVVAHVPDASRRAKQIIRKSIREMAIPVRSAIRKYYVELAPPTLDDLRSDVDRLIAELKSSFGLGNLDIDYTVLTDLTNVLHAGDWKITVTIWMARDLSGVSF